MKSTFSTFKVLGINGINAIVDKARNTHIGFEILNLSVGKIVEKNRSVIGIKIPNRDAFDQNKAPAVVWERSVIKLVKIQSEIERTRIQKDLLIFDFGLLCKTKKAKKSEITSEVMDTTFITFSVVNAGIATNSISEKRVEKKGDRRAITLHSVQCLGSPTKQWS